MLYFLRTTKWYRTTQNSSIAGKSLLEVKKTFNKIGKSIEKDSHDRLSERKVGTSQKYYFS